MWSRQPGSELTARLVECNASCTCFKLQIWDGNVLVPAREPHELRGRYTYFSSAFFLYVGG